MLYIKRYTFLVMILACAKITQGQPATVPGAYPVTMNLNAIRTWDALGPGLDTGNIQTGGTTAVRQATAYFDGLGRPVQGVVRQGSPGGKDLVSMNLFDAFGREERQYLPYVGNSSDGKFRTDPFAEQSVFAQAQYPGETFFYGQAEFEPSPLNRVLKTMPAGNSWSGSGRGTQAKHVTNTVADSVMLWRVPANNDGNWAVYAQDGRYQSGKLGKAITTDEHGKQVLEYKDEGGRTVLKKVQLTAVADNGNGSGHSGWLCTYYMYDGLGRLRCVLQPKAVAALLQGTPLEQVLDELAFRYEYNYRNLPIVKKVPGAAAVYMVYDGRDRLVMTQDGNQRQLGKWLVTRYDDKNRPVATGLWTSSQSAAYHWGQAQGSNAYPSVTGTGYELLTETYYDNYNYTGAMPYNNGYGQYLQPGNNPYPDMLPPVTDTRGLVTGSKTKVLDAGPGQPLYLLATIYYDKKDRAVQVLAQNIKGGTDVTSNLYGWNGKLLCSYLHHRNPASAQTPELRIATRMEYDKDGRLLKTFKRIQRNVTDNAPEQMLSQNEYDALGQLKKKELVPSGMPLEVLDYEYNIRGWLTSINKNYAKGYNNNNYFGQLLSYDKPFDAQGGAAQYNGNISGTRWRGKGDGEQRNYGFEYDAANRLAKADFTQYTNGSWNTAAGVDYSVAGADNGRIGYDGNGNILSMWQKGLVLNGSQWIDQLAYSYQANSNKLLGVTDAVNNQTSTLGDFKYNPATKTAVDYTYDANGNMTVDNNKAIGNIAYNYLNLPQLVTVTGKGTVGYVYDAAGNKLQKRVTEGSRTTVTDYITGIEYKNDTLQQVGHEEGRARWALKHYLNGDSSWVFAWDFFLKDHLGSVRTVLTTDLDTVKYVCTFEPPGKDKERAQFVRRDEAIVALEPDNPLAEDNSGLDGSNDGPAENQFACRLNGRYLHRTIGPGKVLKVMAGDRIEIATRAYCNLPSGTPLEHIPPEEVLQSLLPLFTGANSSTITHGAETFVQGNGLTLNQTALLNFISNNQNNTANDQVKAYMNYIVLDNQFKAVASGALPVQNNFGSLQNLYTFIPVTKNGFVYVWLSNATAIDVDFDNLSVTHYTGALLEENTYYPFGLTMGGLSATAALRYSNAYKYNGKQLQNLEFTDGSGLEWLDYGARMYDTQVGRWKVIDAMTDKYVSWNGYNYCLDNPINVVDPDGNEVILLTWATKGGDVGHTAIAIRNYTAEKVRVNGKLQTVYKPTDNYTLYELGPATRDFSGDNKRAAQEDRMANYGNGKRTIGIYTKDELLANQMKDNQPVSEYDKNPADGIISFGTGTEKDYKTDQASTAILNAKSDAGRAYNGIKNNCTSFCSDAIPTIGNEKIDANETITFLDKKLHTQTVTTQTPNKLYRAAAALKNANILRKANEDLVNKDFLKAFLSPSDEKPGGSKLKN